MTAALFATQAGAAVIDFDGAVQGGQIVADPVSYTEAGFALAAMPAGESDISALYGPSAAHAHTNGSAVYGFCTYDLNCARGKGVYLSLAATDAGAFSLRSIDAANLDLSGRTGTIDLVGHLRSGGTVLASVGAGVWASYQLSGFTDLRSVDFYGRGITAVAIDNLVVDAAAAAPEPGSIALMLLGLAGLASRGCARRAHAGALNG